MGWATYLALCALLVGVFLVAFAVGRFVAPPGRERAAGRRAQQHVEAGPTTTLDGTG